MCVFIWVQGRKVKGQVASHSTTRVPHFIVSFPVLWSKVVIPRMGMGGEGSLSMVQSLQMRTSNWSTLDQVWHAFLILQFVSKSFAHISFLLGLVPPVGVSWPSLSILWILELPGLFHHAVSWWKWRWQNSSKRMC